MKPENDPYSEIRRLVSLKRFEQPPPGYFPAFSVRVMARIEALERLQRLPWWQRWLVYFEERPMLAGASGVACCGVLLCGLSLSQLAADTSMQISNLMDPVETASLSAVTGITLFSTSETPPAHASVMSSPNPALLDEPPELALRTLGLKTMAVNCQFLH